MQHNRYILDDETWDELMTVTSGAVAVCYQCGVCSSICPWGEVLGEPISIRKQLRQAQLGLLEESNKIWYCTTCGVCEYYCPRGVKIMDVFRGLRYLAWKHNHPHHGLNSLLWSIYWNNNPWDQPPSQRTNWSKGLKLPEFDPKKHEILFYVGCTPSYDTRAQKISRALVKIFRTANVSFGTLGENEPCSGEEVLSIGHLPYFQEIVEKTTTTLNEWGVTHLVTIDPHSYDVFRNHYHFSEEIIIQHYTQFLAQLLENNRLKFHSSPLQSTASISYHDPCYLSRHNNELSAPRRILEAIPGVILREMEHAGVDTICCGGGGGRMWIDTDPGERFSDLRLIEAIETKVDYLATSCPYCISCLEDSLKSKGIESMQVLDIAEIIAQTLIGTAGDIADG